MKYSYSDTLNDYLEGHISLEEAETRLNSIELDGTQASEWQRLKSLDAMLTERSQAGPALPWLEVSVTSRIEARQRARQWVHDNPAGLFSRLKAAAVIRSVAFWQVALVSLACGIGGYWFGSNLSLASSLGSYSPAGMSVALLSALLGAGAGAIAAAFPRIRNFYS